MGQPKIEVTAERPATMLRDGEVRIIGSAVIARFSDCMLKHPKKAEPVSKSR